MIRSTRRFGAAALAAGCLLTLAGCGDSDTTVERPSPQDAQPLVEQLDRAYQVQDVCYGWVFRPQDGEVSYYEPVSEEVGSNFGHGEAVEGHDCERAVEVHIDVTYTSMSSELADSASLDVATSGDLPANLGPQIETALRERFGVTEAALIDDPVGALGRAVLALPLLVAEQGAASPAPTPSQAAGTVEELPSGGSDFLRSHWGALLAAVVMLLVAAVLVGVALATRRREQQAASRRLRPTAGRGHRGRRE